MSYTARLAICVAASLAAHALLARESTQMSPRVPPPRPVVLRVQVREAPPEPPPEPVKPEPVPKQEIVHERPTRQPRKVAMAEPQSAPPPKQPTPSERTPTSADTTNVPVFGISMESTSAAGSGPSVRVGNTLQTKPREHPVDDASNAGKALAAAPVQAYEVTKMPLPKGECSGQYTDEARAAGLEGVVIFDIVVDEQGRTRDIKVVQGLGAGLTEAAKRAVQGCRFTPGERDGKPVPVRVRSFKIRFTLRENE